MTARAGGTAIAATFEGDGGHRATARLPVLAATAALALLAAPSAQATDVGGSELAPLQLAQAERRAEFDIPAQPLARALTAFGRQAGVQVAVDSNLVAGWQSTGVSGNVSLQGALERLLAGTGLSYQFTSANAVTVERGRGSDSLMLGPITVEGRTETAHGPVDGYVAGRSATATKTDTPLIETPRSVSVVTREQIEALKPRTVAEALNYSPGIVTGITGAQPNASNAVVRGFQQFSTDTYQDGLQLSFPDYSNAIAREPYALERVELLRGPASILYGQISPGGVINAVSKRPLDDPRGEASLEAGSFERKQGAFDVNLPVNEDRNVLFRLVGVARDSDTQVDHTKDNRTFLSAGLTWKLNASTDITLLAEQQVDDSNFLRSFPASGTLSANPNGRIPSSRFLGEPDFSDEDLERTSLGYIAEHRGSEVWTFRQNFRYSHDKGELLTLFPGGYQADQRTLNRLTSALDTDADTIGVDTQAQARFATGSVAHTALAGTDYRRTSYERQFGFGAGPSIDIFSPTYGQTVTHPGYRSSQTDELHEQFGVYAQEQAKIHDNWVLQIGGRHDWAQSRIDNRLTLATTKTHDSEFSGQAGLVYLFDNGFAPYVSYAESFQPENGTNVSGNPFEPTRGVQYEAGLKYEPADYNAAVTLSAYQLTRENVTTPDLVNVGFNVQTGEVRSRGLELEARASLALGIDVVAAYTLQDVEVTESNGSDRGKTPTRTPDQLASLWAGYGIDSGLFKGLRIGAGARYVGETHADAANTTTVPSFTIVDANLSYEVNGFVLGLSATNLFDKEYVAACSNTASFCFFGARRSVIGSVTYRW